MNIVEGQRFGKLTVIGFAGSDESGHKLYYVLCDCGTKFVATGSNLTSGRTRSCSCTRRTDLTGQVFGKLTVVSYHSSRNGKAMWLCRCECGREKVVSADNLRRGRSTHCGCSRIKRTAGPKLGLFTFYPVREPALDELLEGAYSNLDKGV